jgi:hypothetical protein
VCTPEHAWPALWLPLFLIWPLLLLLLVPLTVLGLLVAIVLDSRHIARAFELMGAVLAAVCGLRGVDIDVVGERGQVLISFH